MPRRFFLSLFRAPALAFLRPRTTQAEQPPLRAGLTYTDSENSPDLGALADGSILIGVEYAA